MHRRKLHSKKHWCIQPSSHFASGLWAWMGILSCYSIQAWKCEGSFATARGERFCVWGFAQVPFDGFVASSLTLTVDALFSDLTEKQMDAFLTAYSNGYYKLPRKADVTTIASKGECREQHFKNVWKKPRIKSLCLWFPIFNYLGKHRKRKEKASK